MNKLSTSERARVVAALVEGNSIRSVSRMTGIARNTIDKLLGDMGAACAAFAAESIRGVASKQIQCDEIWAFCYAKEKNVPAEKRGQPGYGDVWTWTAIDADTKLIVNWHVGQRTASDAHVFLCELADRVVGRPQVTTDALAAYKFTIRTAFERNVDHATVVKHYGPVQPAGRYSPPVCLSCTKEATWGDPDMGRANTSFVERQNLTMRMAMRRFTRLTNGFSKKLANHEASVNLHFVHYNFCRSHITLAGKTPAQAAGLAAHKWTLEELVGLLERSDRKAA